jgi:hypothetical protein
VHPSCNERELEISDGEIWEFTNRLQLNNTLQTTSGSRRKHRDSKYLGINESRNTTYQTLLNTVKAGFGEEFVAINTCIINKRKKPGAGGSCL